MKICLNTSTIKPVPLLEKIKLVGEAGYGGIELWLNDVWDFVARGGEVSDVTRAVEDQGLIVPSVIAMRQWGDFEGWEHQLVLDEARRRFALGARLGAPFIVATPPLENPETSHLAGRYKELLQIGREEGIKPTFEYISFFKSVHTLNRAWEIVQEADDPDATLILDAFHNWNSGSTKEDLLSIPLDRISHYHIDDADPKKAALTQTDPDRVMPGDGQIDLNAEIQILKQKGYDGTVSLELFNEEWWAKDPAETLRVGLERVSALVNE
jgi:sugar phosphate isomerase/epimerase